MKIAIIGSFGSIAPYTIGKIHAPLKLTYELALGLAKRGHKVTFFGRVNQFGQKHPNLKIDEMDYQPIPEDLLKDGGSLEINNQLVLIYEQGYISKIFSDDKINEFDLVYSWAGYRVGVFSRFCKIPVVITHHDSTNLDKYNLMFESMKNKNLWMIPISDSMKEKLKFDNMLEVVYHGIDTTQIKNFSPEDYFCWVGRVAPSKGLHIAMDVAEKLNLKLKIAGPMTDVILDFGDVSKYIEDIRNRIKKSKNFEYLGILGPKETMELIGKSKGLIFPSDGNESFSMVTAEAIISGTPAIVSNLGPLPELVKDRVNGFVCSDTKEIIEAVKNIDTIDRLKCRENAISRFSLDIMVKNYEEQFERATKLIKG